MRKIFAFLFCFVLFPSSSFSWPFEEVNSWVYPYADRDINVSKSALPYIYKEFPGLQNKIPYISLGQFPTPVKKLESLGNYLGVKNLYFKDDGISAPFFGGNKIRKLEFLLADVLYSGAKSIITIGDAGSNCVSAALVQAKRVGFKDVYCLLGPQLNAPYLRRNLLVDLFYGGIIRYYESEEKLKEEIWKFSDKLQSEGKNPYIITWGGSCPVGFLGYMNAAFELKEQISQGLLPEPDYIYIPLGSAGTAGGLILGAQLAGLKSKIIPVAISGKNGDAYYRTERLAERINEAVDFFVNLSDTFPDNKFSHSDLEHRNNFANCSYAQVTDEVSSSLQKLYELGGVKLEGTYTGKALTVMFSDIASKKDLKEKNILFWNTFCYETFEDVTNKVNYKDLPVGLHKYFETVNFDFVFELLKNGETEKVCELIKLGAPAAVANDISKEVEKKITGVSYKQKCIDLKDLSILTIIHWGFDDKPHVGEMIVNKKLAKEVVEIFTDLFNAKYSIEKIRLIDEYDADDDKSMADNNSSALCCRVITGHEKKKNPTWSKHSYGTAIDINPKQNPYVKPYKDLVLPPNGKNYVDRKKVQKGMIIEGDACYKAFVSRGWQWGGDWDPSPPSGRVDYQHFDKDIKKL
jgi:1-aminocyclopropane-1-carboxylate deaminase/D-cysteine desulfhydrase-like pyridoxal-dependent ACC family enzyme